MNYKQYAVALILFTSIALQQTARADSIIHSKSKAENGLKLNKNLWMTDLDQAIVISKQKNIPILVCFSNNGKDFESERSKVLSTPIFETWAKKNAVLYCIDYNPNFTKYITEVKKLNAWCPAFPISVSPVIYLIKPTGELIRSEKLLWSNFALDKDETGQAGIMKTLISKRLIAPKSESYPPNILEKLSPDPSIFVKHMRAIIDKSTKPLIKETLDFAPFSGIIGNTYSLRTAGSNGQIYTLTWQVVSATQITRKTECAGQPDRNDSLITEIIDVCGNVITCKDTSSHLCTLEVRPDWIILTAINEGLPGGGIGVAISHNPSSKERAEFIAKIKNNPQ